MLESPIRFEDLNPRQKYELMKSRGTIKSTSKKETIVSLEEESKYTSIFENRKQIHNELDQLRPEVGVDIKKDPKMWRY